MEKYIGMKYIGGFILVTTILLVTFLAVPVSVVYSQEAIPREDTLFVTGAQWSPPSTWNPLSPSQTWGTQSFGGFLYLPLFQYVPGLDAWIPIIGEKFEFLNEYVLRIYIRQEAKWSDGTPITAYDVEFTYNISIALGSGPAAGSQPYIASMKAVNDKIVDVYINNETRNYMMFLQYALQFTPVPRHIYETVYSTLGNRTIEWRNCAGLCDDLVNLPQVVSGPYRLYYFDELRVIYERIDDWWGKSIFGLPGPKYIVHRIYLSNEQATLDLMQGYVDWSGIFIPYIWQLYPHGVGTYYKDKPYYRPNQILVLYLNQRVDYLRDPVLKKAIAYAIEYDELIEKAWYGYTTQASMSFVFEIYPQFKKWINQTLALEYWGTSDAKVKTDKEYARKLLDENGWRDIDGDGFRETPRGEKFNITIMVPTGWTDWMVAADLIAGDLKDIGINAQAFPVDYGAYWGYINSGSYTAVLGWTNAPTFMHPWDTYRYLLDPRLTPPIGNWEWYNRTDIIQILEEAARARTSEERMMYFSRLQEIIYQDIPSIPLVYTPQWYSYSKLYWNGWPSDDDPWWTEVAPYKEYSLALWLTFGLVKKGQQPTVPSWAKTVDKGGILIPNSAVLNMLVTLGQPVITETETMSPTETETVTTPITTSQTSQTTMTSPAVPERATSVMYIIVVIVVIIIAVIIGVRLYIKKR